MISQEVYHIQNFFFSFLIKVLGSETKQIGADLARGGILGDLPSVGRKPCFALL